MEIESSIFFFFKVKFEIKFKEKKDLKNLRSSPQSLVYFCKQLKKIEPFLELQQPTQYFNKLVNFVRNLMFPLTPREIESLHLL